MKYLLASVLFCVSLGNASPLETELIPTDKKKKTEHKKGVEGDAAKKKNMHSIKKWKMTVEYTNGNTISKTIVVSKNSKLSALETALEEVDKYLKNIKDVKDYSISPVTNSYVLLAGD